MPEDVQIPGPAIVRVLFGVNPLVATNKATSLQFYDRDGALMALFWQGSKDGDWKFSFKNDPDWSFHRGYVDAGGSGYAEPNSVRVLSGRRPELETTLATVAEIYDRAGNLSALFFRQFAEGMWIFAKKGDEDWRSHLIRLGYEKSDLKPYAGGVMEG